MAALNGTALLLYSDGVCVAMQKGISITVETDQPDATNKESAGWAQHINGMRNAKIDFTALFSSPASPDMSGKRLMEYILTRTSLLVSVLGLSFPIVGEADMSSLSIDAPQEGVMSLSGSLKIKGQLYCLTSLPTGYNVQLMTDPDAGGTGGSPGYAIFTVSGVTVASAIMSGGAGTAFSKSNLFAIDIGIYKVAFFLTKTSGQLPLISIYEVGYAVVSNEVSAVEGLNIITLTTTIQGNGELHISNTNNCNWSCTPIYLFRAV